MNAVRAHGLLLLMLAIATLGACADKRAGEAAAAKPVATPYLAMARGQVDVEGGLVRIVAARDGRVAEVKVEDGDRVSAGEVVALLDPKQARIALDVARATAAHADAEISVLKARLEPAQTQVKRIGEAAGAGAATGQSADDALAALAVLKAQITVAQAAAKVAHEHVAEAQAEVDARTITTPVAGTIVHRSVHIGDIVSAQTATELFQVLPDRPRIVRAELNEAYVDLVKPGMQAEVVRDSEQGAAVPARVVRVGQVFGPSRLTDDPVERASAHDVECVLELDGGEFRIGQRVLVRFKR